MAQRGRKPKPTAMKELEGNPGRRQLNENEPRPERRAPRCPSWLEDEAKKEWRRMGKIRTPNGYLQQVPQVSIAQTNQKIMLRFCEQFGLTPSARSRIIAGDGSVEPYDEMERLLGGDE